MQRLETSTARPRRQTQARPLVVLAVDNEKTRSEYAYVLSASGFDVAIQRQGERWHACAGGSRPSIIVVEVAVEKCDGWVAVQTFRRDPETSDAPIIAAADDVGTATRDRARREGCIAVCLKQCSAEALAAGLQAVLGRADR